MSQKYLHCELLYEDSMNNITRVIQLEDNSLYTMASLSRHLRGMGSYPKHQFVFSRRSYDGGVTWSMPYPLFEIPDTKAYVRMMPFFISKAGYIHGFLVRIKVYDFEKTDFQGDILHVRMDDVSGKNTRIEKINCLNRYTGALNNLIQLENGRIVVPFSTLKDGSQTFVSNTIYSDDEGITWKVSNDISVISKETDVESGAVEPVITEISKNKLVMIIRTVLGYFYYSISSDGGATWSTASRSDIKSSNAPAVLQKMNDGRILIVWNNCNGTPMRGVRYSMARQCLHAAVSEDGLKTLKGCRVIVKKEEGDPDGVLNCYPYASKMGDKDVLIKLMTVNGKDNEDWVEPNAKLIKMQPDFLNESSFLDDFTAGPGNWVTDYTHTEIISVDGKNALSINSTQDTKGYAMVNFPYGQKGKIEIHYETSQDFTQANLIISDNYIDQSSFDKDEENEKYREFIDENYIDVKLDGTELGRGRRGTLTVNWDCTAGEIIICCNNKSKTIDIPSAFKGFNYTGIVIPGGSSQSFIIKDFREESKMAWLDTGIEY